METLILFIAGFVVGWVIVDYLKRAKERREIRASIARIDAMRDTMWRRKL